MFFFRYALCAGWTSLDPRDHLTLASAAALQACLVIAWAIERAARTNPAKTSERVVAALHAANALACLGLPTLAVWVDGAPGGRGDPLSGSALLFAAIILFLKLVSYAHVNYDYRFVV